MQLLTSGADWLLKRARFPNFRDRVRGRTFVLVLGLNLLFQMSLSFLQPLQSPGLTVTQQILVHLAYTLGLLVFMKMTGRYRLAAVFHFLLQEAHLCILMYESQSLHSIYFASIGTDVVVASFILGLRLATPLVLFHTVTTLSMIAWSGPYATRIPHQLELAAYAQLVSFSLLVAQLVMIVFSFLYHSSLQEDYARLQSERTRLFRSARTFDLSRMLGELNHHMNNPLSIIHAQLYRMAWHARQGSSRIFEQQHENSSQQALQKIRFIVEHLKVLAAPDSQEAPSTISVRSLCLHILTHFQELFRLQGIALHFIDQTMNMNFNWRRHELFTILIAVIQNAGEALENSAEKQITMRVERYQQWLIFVISDTGPGISGQQRTQLFKPFHSTKQASQHLGLSLLSSKAVLEDRGGFIVCDDVAHGCAFQIGLPLLAVGA